MKLEIVNHDGVQCTTIRCAITAAAMSLPHAQAMWADDVIRPTEQSHFADCLIPTKRVADAIQMLGEMRRSIPKGWATIPNLASIANTTNGVINTCIDRIEASGYNSLGRDIRLLHYDTKEGRWLGGKCYTYYPVQLADFAVACVKRIKVKGKFKHGEQWWTDLIPEPFISNPLRLLR